MGGAHGTLSLRYSFSWSPGAREAPPALGISVGLWSETSLFRARNHPRRASDDETGRTQDLRSSVGGVLDRVSQCLSQRLKSHDRGRLNPANDTIPPKIVAKSCVEVARTLKVDSDSSASFRHPTLAPSSTLISNRRVVVCSRASVRYVVVGHDSACTGGRGEGGTPPSAILRCIDI